MTFDFTDKVVVVTGASGNLGRAVVKGFAEAGAKVALIDLRQDRLDQAILDLGLDATRCKAFPGDLSDQDKVDALVSSILDQYGQIDVLAHTVGGFAMGDPVHTAGLDVLRKMFDLNVVPLYLMGGAVAKHMVDRGGKGSIIFVLARSGLKGIRNQAAYTASKAAAFRVMESMALELRDHEIRVNGVSPSIIDTPPNRASMPDADPSKWVTPEQIANGILFLASEQAAGVYGTNLEIYGRS
jgi:NAD(P)-dependent dehydrogenase (short-subunit alcohol dehydrogenase family)